MLHSHAEVKHVLSDFPLVNQALVLGINELDRVFQCEDVLAVNAIDVIQHRSDRCTFTAAGNPGQQDHALVVVAKFLHRSGQIKSPKVGNEIVDTPCDQSDLTQLLQQVNSETPIDPIDIDDISEVGAALLIKNCQVAVIHHRQQQPDHLLVIDRRPIEWP